MGRITRPTQIIFIRHAESARNKAKRGSTYFADDEARKTVKGVPDHKIPLTEDGMRQARETGIHLYERFGVPDYAYHSGYLRTIQTLDRILEAIPQAERAKIQVRKNVFIRERDPGYTYDMTTAEAESHFPWLKEHWQTFGGFFAAPPGGESLAKVAERVYLFLNTLFRDRIGQKIWVVLHGGTLRSIRYILERWDYDRALKWPKGESPKNCGITVYNFDRENERMALQEYNTVVWK